MYLYKAIAAKFRYEWTEDGMRLSNATVRFGKREGHPSVAGWRLVGAEDDDTLLVGVADGDGIIPAQDVDLTKVMRNREHFTSAELCILGFAHDMIHNSPGRTLEDALSMDGKRIFRYDWDIVETQTLVLSKVPDVAKDVEALKSDY